MLMPVLYHEGGVAVAFALLGAAAGADCALPALEVLPTLAAPRLDALPLSFILLAPLCACGYAEPLPLLPELL